MAGIDAPQVKIGRALDLSAFSTTPEEYQRDWLNLFDGEFKQNENKPKISIKNIFKNILPFLAFGGGMALSSLLDGDKSSLVTAMAMFPFIGTFANFGEGKETEYFLNLRKKFNEGIFSGPTLNEEEKENMRRTLGDEFYELWQKYYNVDLEEFANDHPEELAELIRYSNRYENTLPTLNYGEEGGTNPLYVKAMKDMAQAFEEDLLQGKTFRQAVEEMGKTMFQYGLNINKIKMFKLLKSNGEKIDWADIDVPLFYDEMDDVYAGKYAAYRIGYGILNQANSSHATPFDEDNYGEYLNELLSSYGNLREYKGINLSYVDFKFHKIIHPAGIAEDGRNNIDRAFEVIEKDYEKVALTATQPGGMLSRRDRTATRGIFLYV